MHRHFLVTILMVIVGAFLLLPGVCALFFIFGGGFSGVDSSLVMLWMACFLVSAGGIWLLVKALR